MLQYIVQRLILLVATLVGVLTITFVLTRVLPGSPVQMLLGFRPTAEQIEAVRHKLGLDLSLPQQYLRFIGEILQGELGTSLLTKQPVILDIEQRFMATVELSTLAMLLVLAIGVPIGVIAAARAHSVVDRAAQVVSIAGVALPAFIVGMLLQMLFYGKLNWLPLQGRLDATIMLDHPFPAITGLYLVDTLLDGNGLAFASAAGHLVLPLATLVLGTLPLVTRITRNLMVEVLGEDYIRTVVAYGLPRRIIYFRYALKAMLIPLLTVVGLTYGYLLGGTVVIEFVFDWPGLGGYVTRAITQTDFPAVIGVTLVLATAYLTVNLVVDLLYFLVDPRLRRP